MSGRVTGGSSAPGWRLRLTALAVGVLLLAVAFGVGAVVPTEIRTDSKSPYVHRIELYDEDGNTILAGEDKPFSTRKTCGKCHDYARISEGWHFNAFDAKVPPGRIGQPWVLTDPATGTQLPLSYRPWPGTYRPAAAGMTPWRFVKSFGRHIPGGGPGAPAAGEIEKSPERVQWTISGGLEIDCMSCHSAEAGHDQAERSMQVAAENLRWIPSAVSGLAIVRGKAAEVMSPDLESQPKEMVSDTVRRHPSYPKVIYNAWRFDKDNRVLFNITRKAPAERCYFCHSTRPVGPQAPQAWQLDTDVHMAAGLTCTTCHRNGLDHGMTRGYEGEKVVAGQGALSDLSCRGCHLGQNSASAGPMTAGGRLGAPVAKHVGLPTVHLEKLTCTACHSGPWPLQRSQRVQTAQTHGLGTVSGGHAEDEPPLIAEPAFVRQADGKIGLHRMVWPAFWGRMDAQGVTPMDTKSIPQAVKETLKAKEPAEARVAKAIEILARQRDEAGQAIPGEPVYVSGGKLYRRGADGALAASDHPAAKPYSWPFAHEVRPAKYSLGANSQCTDCHSVDSPVFFGQVTAESPLKLGAEQSRPMCELMGVDEGYHKLFGWSFTVRPLLKVVCSISALVVAVVLVLYGFQGLAACLRAARRKPGRA